MDYALPLPLRLINPLIRWTGYQFILSCIGYWRTDAEGNVYRTSIPVSWRLASRSHWQGLPPDATEMDRLMAQFKSEIRR